MPCLANNGALCSNYTIRKASRFLGGFYDDVLLPCKLRSTQYALLVQIDRLGTPSMTELASELVLDRSALSHTIRPLERDGLIALVSSTHDRRVKRIMLTDAGQQRLKESEVLWAQAQAAFEQTFGHEQTQALSTTLDALTKLRLRVPKYSITVPDSKVA